MATLTKDDFTAGFALKVVPVDLAPDLDKTAYLKQLSSDQMIALTRAQGKEGKKFREDEEHQPRYLQIAVAACLSDENGNLLFDTSEESVAIVSMLPLTAISKLYEELQKINPISGRYSEELAKNLPAQSTIDSSADSCLPVDA